LGERHCRYRFEGELLGHVVRHSESSRDTVRLRQALGFMDVRCENCQTEYEFDDALVSARGTTVKCTQCGHQFKIQRRGDPSQDRWLVTTSSGQELVFTSLAKLQRALLSGEVKGPDVLVRGADAPRTLASIPELAPFLGLPQRTQTVRASVAPPPASVRTRAAEPSAPRDEQQQPVAPAELATSRPSRSPSSGDSSSEVNNPPRDHQLPRDVVPMRRDQTPARVEPAIVAAAIAEVRLEDAAPRGVDVSSVGETSPMREHLFADSEHFLSSPIPPPLHRPKVASLPELEEDDEPPPVRRGTRVGGWVVAAVVLGGIATVGVAWLKQRPTREPAPAASVATDVDLLMALSAYESALGSSDFPGAEAALQRAVQRAAQDSRVLVARARLTNRQADLAWIEERAAVTAQDRARRRADVRTWSDKVRQASLVALEASPNLSHALLARVDALRIAGEREQARTTLAKVPLPLDLEGQYASAMLDMTDPDPLWPDIISRLRAAAAAETLAGRARCALVLAMTLAGRQAEARVEWAHLGENPKLGAVTASLRTFLEAQHESEDASTPSLTSDAAALPLPEDPRRLVAEGAASVLRGDLDRARASYGSALAKNPQDSEALAGMGDVERASGNPVRAKDYYRRALGVNPNFLPALLAVADLEWDAGERGVAARMYRDISDRFPDSSYPARVRERSMTPGGAASSQGAGAAASSAPSLPSASASPPPTAPTLPAPSGASSVSPPSSGAAHSVPTFPPVPGSGNVPPSPPATSENEP
jgi:predicted Zn finger-like uncharacterized protein